MALRLKNVLISDEVDQKCVDILRANGIAVEKNTKLSKDELIAEIPKYDGLIVRSATKVTADVIAAAQNLKIIGRAGTGVDNIDCKAATQRGIIVMNTPGGNTLSAAEHTCMFVMALSRHVAQGSATLKAGQWERKKLMGNEVFGKTLAIIGLGRIGKEVALRMQAFGMTTIGFDPIIPGSVSSEFGVEWLPLEQLWPRADYITVHTPLIPQTKHLLNDTTFGLCKRGVRVINCARGGIIDEDALLRALKSGQCGGAALDVFVQEPPPVESELLQHPNLTCTPHLGASTVEAQSRVAEDIAQQFVNMVNGTELFGAINAPALTHALSPATCPWVEAGTALGLLAAALLGLGPLDPTMQVKVIAEGPALKDAGSYLGAAVLVGLLKASSVSKGPLNLVSAPALATQLQLKVATEYVCASSERITLVVQQTGGALYRLVAVVGGGVPLLVSINDSEFVHAAALQGVVLLYCCPQGSDVLGAVSGGITAANRSIVAFSSAVSANQSWGVVRLSAALVDIRSLASSASPVLQVEL